MSTYTQQAAWSEIQEIPNSVGTLEGVVLKGVTRRAAPVIASLESRSRIEGRLDELKSIASSAIPIDKSAVSRTRARLQDLMSRVQTSINVPRPAISTAFDYGIDVRWKIGDVTVVYHEPRATVPMLSRFAKPSIRVYRGSETLKERTCLPSTAFIEELASTLRMHSDKGTEVLTYPFPIQPAQPTARGYQGGIAQ